MTSGGAAALELGQRRARVAGLRVGMALVVEVVQQPGDAPELLVGAELAGVGAHRGLDGEAVAAQRLRLAPTRQQGPGLVARKGRGHGCCLAERLARPARRRPREPPTMEKFVIEGGVPLSGTIVPAGNKNGALPHPRRLPADRGRGRAAQRPAHPRRRGDARAARGPRRRASRGARRTSSRSAPPASTPTRTSTATSPSASAPRSCSPARCSPALAAPTCRRRAAT